MPEQSQSCTRLPDYLFGILKGYEWGVTVALAYYGQSSHPSHKQLARVAGISVKTTKKMLDSLREKGLVDWETRTMPDGGQGSNTYKLYFDL